MPIWARCILMLWVITLVCMCFSRMWTYSDETIERIVNKDYPLFLQVLGFLIVFSILSIIPFFGWVIFS